MKNIQKKIPILKKVLENDLCISCGACLQVCNSKNKNNIIVNYDDYNACYNVKIVDIKECSNCDFICDTICPSIEIDFTSLLKRESLNSYGNILSYKLSKSVLLSSSTNTSSGGIIRKIALEGIKMGYVVVSLKEENNTYQAGVFEEVEDIDKMPSSIYHSVSFVNSINLLRNSKKGIILISLPCQLEGIINYLKNYENDIMDKIVLKIGLICGWMYSLHSINSFCNFNGINFKNVIDIKYRGEDQKGLLKIKTENKTFKFKRWKFDSINEMFNYNASFSRYSNLLRCRLCQNHTNILSDISIGDAWLKNNKEKKSLIIVRSEIGNIFFDKFLNEKDIIIEESNFDDLIISQSKSLVFNIESLKHAKFFDIIGRFHPNYIFNNKEKASIGFFTIIDFYIEILLRSVLRKGKYNLFRNFYILVNIKRIVFFNYKKLYNLFKSK